MQNIHFIGRVLPSAFKVSVQAPEVKWKWEETELELTIRVKIGNSFVNIECELEEYRPEYVTELYRRAFDLQRASVNLVAFANGIGLTVLLEMLIAPDGSPTELAPTTRTYLLCARLTALTPLDLLTSTRCSMPFLNRPICLWPLRI